jgi:hypothetical protein
MLILERIKGSVAVISGDDGEFTVSAEMVKGCCEGDVVVLSGDRYITDRAATEKRRRDIISLQNSLWED